MAFPGLKSSYRLCFRDASRLFFLSRLQRVSIFVIYHLHSHYSPSTDLWHSCCQLFFNVYAYRNKYYHNRYSKRSSKCSGACFYFIIFFLFELCICFKSTSIIKAAGSIPVLFIEKKTCIYITAEKMDQSLVFVHASDRGLANIFLLIVGLSVASKSDY